MRRVSPKAILIASAVMLAMDMAGSVILMLWLGRQAFQEGMTPEQTQAALEAVNQSSAFLFCGLVYGTLTTIFGGYFAARLARGFPYFNAGAFGLIGIALCVLLAGSVPLWLSAITVLTTLPAALFGGHLAKQRANAPVELGR